ncbi:MAG: PKD domain-containing protein [Nitrospirota bacterium]
MQKRKKHITFFLINLLLTCFLLSSGYAFADVIIDNGQAGTSYTGTWGISGGTLPYGTNSLWSRDGATYTWQFSSQPAGTYEVYMWWSGYATRATSIAVDIYHRDGQSTVTVNQQLNAGQWNSLGQYYFDTSGRVTIIAANGSTVSTCADAVRFAPVSTNSPPTAYIDSITPNPANPGQTVSFSGHGTDSDGTIAAYQWSSNINGLLSTESAFSSSTLSAGTHTISFRVQDNEGAWSAPVAQTLQVGAPPVEYIIDNGAAGTSFTGTWAISGASNPYAIDSVWSRDGTTYTWTFTPAVSGNYDLSMWWTVWPSRSTAVPVDITFYGGTSRVVINQQLNGGKWNLLGNFSFLAGQSYTVRITSQPGPSSTCADAVKFSRVSDLNAPPVATIDSVTPNPALPGETVTFTGSGSDTDGTITGYSWRSSRDGVIGTAASFSTSALSEGIHTIYFKVQDNNGVWSPEISHTLNIGNQVSNTEHIYFCLTFFGANDKALLIATLQDVGAVQQGNVWTYTNSALGKDYVIHIVEDIETMKQALYTENAHVIVKGHSNYGLGGVFIPDYAYEHQVLNNIRYIDDDLIFNYSSPWISVNVASCIISHAFPNWWPILQDGTNGIMPYDFGDPRGNPPYNYYLTYQIPGDPNIYKVETVRNSARERFPDSGVPAWYSPDGSSPNPSNPSHRQYYITNPDNSFLSAGRWLWTNNSYAGSLTGFYGFHYCRINAGSGSSQASWRFSIPVSGSYNVSAWWPSSPLNTSQAKYTVNHATGSTLVMQNQQVNGSVWNNLGTFSFNTGEYSVVLTDQSGSGQIVADAIRVTNSANPSIDITVDNSFCPKSHYYKKSIVFRRQLEIEPEKLKYKRMLYDACTTGSYYLEAFQRGTMFFTVIGSRTYGSYKYLKAYLEGKSDQEIWTILQAYDPVYDYYYFDKSPSEQ